MLPGRNAMMSYRQKKKGAFIWRKKRISSPPPKKKETPTSDKRNQSGDFSGVLFPACGGRDREREAKVPTMQKKEGGKKGAFKEIKGKLLAQFFDSLPPLRHAKSRT